MTEEIKNKTADVSHVYMIAGIISFTILVLYPITMLLANIIQYKLQS